MTKNTAFTLQEQDVVVVVKASLSECIMGRQVPQGDKYLQQTTPDVSSVANLVETSQWFLGSFSSDRGSQHSVRAISHWREYSLSR